MRGGRTWSWRPFSPAYELDRHRKPYICRLAPGDGCLEIEWMDNAEATKPHMLRWRRRGDEFWLSKPLIEGEARLDGLINGQEYEIVVERGGACPICSATRLARIDKALGVVVNYLHPEDDVYAFSGHFLCSPSLTVLPSGALLSGMDVYGPRAPQNLTLLFISHDGGASWRYQCELTPCFWATTFVHRGRLFLLAATTEYGDLVLSESPDEGRTWCDPTTLFRGGSTVGWGWAKAVMPVLNHEGRLWFAVEYGRSSAYHNAMISVAEDADLLKADNWLCSDFVQFSPDFPGAPMGTSTRMMEGNPLVSPQGQLCELLRIDTEDCHPSHGRAALLRFDASKPENGPIVRQVIDMPCGSNSKFFIRFDPVSKLYVALGNVCVNEDTPGQRNVVALLCSQDMLRWSVCRLVADYRNKDPREVGLQYPVFEFNGEDLLVLLRVALNRADNYHNSNYQVFMRIADFRKELVIPQ